MKRAALIAVAVLLPLTPLVLHARTTTTFGQNAVGAVCNNVEKGVDFDAIAQCNAGTGAGTMQTAPIILGTLTAPPYANTTCDSGKAGMLQWTGTSFQACGGTSWGSLAAGGALDDLTDAKTNYAPPYYNVFIGSGAGDAVTTGGYNTALGYNALQAATVGGRNTAIGYNALNATVTGSYNTAIGTNAGAALTTGTYNTILGNGVGHTGLTTGSRNILIGTSSAVKTPAVGTNDWLNIGNTIYGNLSTRSVALGAAAVTAGAIFDLSGATGTAKSSMILPKDTTTNRPTAGVEGMIRYNTTDRIVEVYQGSTPTWVQLAAAAGTGTASSTLGASTATPSPYRSGEATTGLYSSAAGQVQTAIAGTERLRVTATGLHVVGNINLAAITNYYSIAGTKILHQPASDTTSIGVGPDTLFSQSATNLANVAIGYQAQPQTTSGDGNNAVGFQALYSNTSGYLNDALGYQALFSNATGFSNVAVGKDALYSNVGGARNTAVGLASLRSNTGNMNTGLGYRAGRAITSGESNVAIGYEVGATTLTTGSNNILIGTSSLVDTPTTGTSNWLNIGNTIYGNLATGSIALGAAAVTIGATIDTSTRTDSIILPKGTDAQRPTGVTGMVRYNTTSNCLETYQGGTPAWLCVGAANLGTSTAAASPYRTGQVNTGLFSPASGVVSVTTLGTERLRVDANGAVKIGAGAVTAGSILELSAGTGTSKSSMILPKDTTANRPTTATAGMVRFNTTTNDFEGYDGTDWVAFSAPGSGEIGEVKIWPAGVVPAGYLECNGAAVSRTTYAALFAVIGTTYGVGDGSTTFNLPDYRGEFIRGWANGSANDPDAASRTNRGDGTAGDVVGSKQAGQNVSHAHDVNPPATASDAVADHAHSIDPPSTDSNTVANHSHGIDPPSTASNTVANHSHGIDPPATNSGSQSSNHIHSINPPSYTTNSGGTHTHTQAFPGYNPGSPTDGGLHEDRGPDTTKTIASSGAHTHTIDMAAFNSGYNTSSHVHATDIGLFASATAGGHGHTTDIALFTSATAGGHDHTIDIASFASTSTGGHSHTTDIASFASTATGGSETRPRNVNVMFIIRYQEEPAAVGSVAALTPQAFALSGDATSTPVLFDGTAPVTMSATVGKIQGRSVASTAPTDGQTLVWNTASSMWQPGSSSLSILGSTTTATSPYRVGQVNTGLYSPASGSVGVVSAGTEIMRVTASGVGVGTTSPVVPLHVAATGASGIAYFTNSDFVNASTGSGVYIATGTSSGNTYSLLQAGINGGANGGNLILNPYAGNVGIGTTTPSSPLTVLNSITATGNRPITIDGAAGSIMIQSSTGGWANYYGYKGSSGTFRGGFGGFGTADALGYYFIGSGHDTATMYVYPDNGNVGIGTINPAEKLAVNGLIVGGIGAQEGGGVLNWNDITNIRSGNGHTLLQGGHTNGPGAIAGSYFHPFNFEYNTKDGSGNITQIAIPYANDASINAGMYMRGRYSGTWTNWVRVITSHTSNGYVALGSTAAPSYQLDVTGDIRTHRNDTTGVIFLGNAGTKYLYFNGTAYHLPGASLIVNGTTYPSDRRLKTDIEPISKDSALQVINKLEPKRFHWHPDSEQGKVNKNYDFGMIAQDVQKILPEVVLETDSTGPGSADGKKAEPKTLNEKLGKTLAIDYTRFVPWLLAGLQEVAKQLKELEARVNALLDFEPRIKKLEAENEKLKAVNDTLNARLKAIEDRLSKKP